MLMLHDENDIEERVQATDWTPSRAMKLSDVTIFTAEAKPDKLKDFNQKKHQTIDLKNMKPTLHKRPI